MDRDDCNSHIGRETLRAEVACVNPSYMADFWTVYWPTVPEDGAI